MNATEKRELAAPEEVIRRGAHGPQVRRIQEWLCLNGHGVELDGDFGPATEAAVRAFQARFVVGLHSGGRSVARLGEVDSETWAELTYQLYDAVLAGEVFSGLTKLHERVLHIARCHLEGQPREVGGQNSGPWVRLYMDGADGSSWPWCAGFVTYVLGQATWATSQANPWRTFSCDELAKLGMGCHQGSDFLSGRSGDGIPRNFDGVRPGDVFLLRRGSEDWVHTGLVTQVDGAAFHTIEGNTNKEGSREGTEVRARVRAFSASTDFILLGGRRD